MKIQIEMKEYISDPRIIHKMSSTTIIYLRRMLTAYMSHSATIAGAGVLQCNPESSYPRAM